MGHSVGFKGKKWPFSSWENPLFLWFIFNSYVTNYQRVREKAMVLMLSSGKPKLKFSVKSTLVPMLFPGF